MRSPKIGCDRDCPPGTLRGPRSADGAGRRRSAGADRGAGRRPRRSALRDRDVVVIAQKIVSKAEGRTVDLADVVPSAEAIALAAEVGKDPRIVEVVLSESVKVVRSRPNLMIMQHRLGLRDGERRRRSVECRAFRRRAARAAAAGRSGRLGRSDPRRAGGTVRREVGRASSATASAAPGAAAPPASRSAAPACRR